MKRIFYFISFALIALVTQAQTINIELWGDNTPVVYQCHTEGIAGSYGKMISDQQLEFWENEDGGIDMRLSYDVTYSKAPERSGAYIYHGKRIGDKIEFDTFEDGDSMDGTADIQTIDKSYMPYEAVINDGLTITWDRCRFKKMIFNLDKGAWIPATK